MVGFFKKLFGCEETLPFDIEKAVGKYLLVLPRCTAKVAVASTKYGDQHYRCDLFVYVNGLLPWAEHHAKAARGGNHEVQAARLALPLWLCGANLSDSMPSYVPPYFGVVLKRCITDFVKQGMCEIVCPDCRQVVQEIDMKKLNENRSGTNNFSWTDEWYCSEGHLLYREDKRLHFHYIQE